MPDHTFSTCFSTCGRAALGLALAAAAFAASQAHAGARVVFVAPRAYSDSVFRDPAERRSILDALGPALERTAARHAPQGETLRIEVLDLRLAGVYDPLVPLEPRPRFVTPATQPMVKLRYALTRDGKLLRSGEATLTDSNFQLNAAFSRSRGRFFYVEYLVDAWLADAFSRG